MSLSYLNEIADFLFLEDPLEKADAIFLPGNAFPFAAEEAARLYREGMAKWIIPSGRYSITMGHFAGVQAKTDVYNGDYETEWAFMRDVLVKNGVPETAIVREDQSTYTWQNALFTAQAIRDAGICVKSAIVCCKPVHARRSKMYYETAMPNVRLLMHPVQAYGLTRENWQTSAQGIDEVLGELMRCGAQFGDILKERLLKTE